MIERESGSHFWLYLAGSVFGQAKNERLRVLAKGPFSRRPLLGQAWGGNLAGLETTCSRLYRKGPVG
jgi:hypothetical protein